MRNKIPIQHFIKEKNERKAFKLEGFRSFLRYITVENGIILVIPICKVIFSYYEIFFIYFKIYWYKLSDSEIAAKE